MAELAIRTEEISLKSGTYGVGNKDIKYVIERQDRRLAKLTLRANLTIGGTVSSLTAGVDRIEGLFKRISVFATDLAGSRREVIGQGSATLLHWQRTHLGKLSRHQATAIGSSATGNYLLEVPLFFMHPLAANPIGYGMSMPLWPKDGSGVGLGDNLEVAIECSAVNGADMSLGSGGATVTFNKVRLMADFVEIGQAGSAAAKIPYIPGALVTTDWDTSGSGTNQSIDVPEDGYLTSLLFEQFSSNSTGARGTVLTDPLNDYFRLFYGASEIDTAYPEHCSHEDELWADSYPTDDSTLNAHNSSYAVSATVPSPNVFTKNFWHRFPQAEARLLNSCPNLWTQGRKGDGFKIKPTNIASSKRLRFTAHKFLVTDPNLVTGA